MHGRGNMVGGVIGWDGQEGGRGNRVGGVIG